MALLQLQLRDYEGRDIKQELSPLELRFMGEGMLEINSRYIAGEVS